MDKKESAVCGELALAILLWQIPGAASGSDQTQKDLNGAARIKTHASMTGDVQGKKVDMDKNCRENFAQQQPGSHLNSVDIMAPEDKTSKKECAGNQQTTDQPAKGESGKFDAKTPIGEAWIDEKQTIHLKMHRTADGMHISGTKDYPLGDKYYDEVMKHIGGLKVGEVKLVLPWPEEKK